MKLKEVINKVIDILGIENEVNVETSSSKLSKLISCANTVYSELVIEYVPLKTSEKITFSDGRAYYASFSNYVREVLTVKNNTGKYDFECYPLYVKSSADGECEVTYLYYPNELTIDSEIILPPSFTAHVLAQGIVSEYFYRTGLVDEAVFYRTRYENSVINVTKKRKSCNLPRRRFI